MEFDVIIAGTGYAGCTLTYCPTQSEWQDFVRQTSDFILPGCHQT